MKSSGSGSFKTGVFLSLIVILMAAAGWQASRGDDDGEALWSRGPEVVPVTNARYEEECGGCHLAYSPGLLPARSWRRIMGGLEDHFGDNAELEPALQAELTDYLVRNSADNGNYRRSRKIMRSLGAKQAPLRIIDIPYIKKEHDELSPRHLERNPKVLSLSQCDACHTRAAEGSFREREIHIPGFGRWDD